MIGAAAASSSSGEVAGGLVAALSAAVLYGSAPVLQAVAALRTTAGRGLGLALVLRLARQWLWLAGLGCEIGAFVLEAIAFANAPATLVAPLMAVDMLVFVLLGFAVLGTPFMAVTGWGAAAMAAGVGLLAVAFSSERTLGRPAGSLTLLCFLGASIGAAAVAALLGNRAIAGHHQTRAAIVFSAASGVAYGFATMATRQVGRTFSADHPLHLLATPSPYVLAGCSVLAISLMQRALQTRPVLTFPVTSAVSAFLPALLGAALLGDPIPSRARLAAFVLALIALAVGLILIGRARSAAQQELGRAENERPSALSAG